MRRARIRPESAPPPRHRRFKANKVASDQLRPFAHLCLGEQPNEAVHVELPFAHLKVEPHTVDVNGKGQRMSAIHRKSESRGAEARITTESACGGGAGWRNCGSDTEVREATCSPLGV
eukprot:scaffold254430_cov31-Tisochrysis_lutea.AAC.4